ncbi:hypothetical protein SELMODRAFT_429316 [Selaginella moellendorffii]|uniref:Pollen Ole e 1 allergen and extensin family protein n=1 Tax=Selaginella moellendorffii TaxID=88036 RepID=D8T5S4_SELML|nr:uncharacterized protein LOC9660549 [Selaginella moellendorffii]EFJ08017.1 hypothetical protein SELMODRAFT_429316 [Selaginella moellendorffii]|eukprot:XP_002990973.1 uncharacterized protein LOC9660549 [Selaginella moellendorffii]
MQLLYAFLLLLILGDASAAGEYSEDGDDQEETSTDLTTVVQGFVSCQDCDGNFDKPSPGALVRVECRDGSYGEAASNRDGFFQIKFPQTYKSVYDPPESCKAMILASPDRSCDTATDLGGGKKGAALEFEKIFMGEAFYKTGPFAFTPYCTDEDEEP